MDAIVSVTSDWAIGKDGGLLVPNRADMRRFVQLTRGCTVLMGRKTLESFPGGPLKGRRNVVVSRRERSSPRPRRRMRPSRGTRRSGSSAEPQSTRPSLTGASEPTSP